MQRSTIISLVVIVAAAGYLFVRSQSTEFGKVYVRDVEVNLNVEESQDDDGNSVTKVVPADNADGAQFSWTEEETVYRSERSAVGVRESRFRTVGLWTAAICTLCIMSFLVGDNIAYRFAEAIFLGVSAAYLMVVGFWGGIVPNLLAKLFPSQIKASFIPGLETGFDWTYLIPLALSAMMLMRLAPKGGWISRWPLAFFIGATAGIKLTAYLGADFTNQIRSTILPLFVMTDGKFDLAGTLTNITIILGVLSCLVYFFFSIEHKGIVGGTARVGIWFLMITFGAGFAYTVMGRIALISERLKFLFDDWLWIMES